MSPTAICVCVCFPAFQFLNQFSDFNETLYERWAVRGQFNVFLEAFAEVRKATVSFVMSVRPYGATVLPMDGFSLNLIFEDF